MTDTGQQMRADDVIDNSSPQIANDSTLLREQRLQRNLKIVVVGLGVLIVSALLAVVAGIFFMSSKPAIQSRPSAASAQAGEDMPLEVPNGAKVISVSLSGNRLAVYYQASSGMGIAILDIETGRRLTNVRLLEALPRN